MHKNIPLVVGITILIVCINLSGCNSPEYVIEAERIDEEPDIYINITEQQIKNYPHLKKAIESEGELIDIPWQEKDKVMSILESKDTDYIKYQNEYYEYNLLLHVYNFMKL